MAQLQVSRQGLWEPGFRLSFRRCRARHPGWTLTFMVDGKKRVERIPNDWVEEVRRRVQAGREFKEAVAEVFAANAQLLVLGRKQRRK